MAAAAIAFTAAVPANAGQPEPADQVVKSASDACSAIHGAISKLAQSERDQALALEIFSHGGQLPMVETRYRGLEQASGDLREILRRVRASRLANDASAAECLKLGYEALFAAEKVASEVERVLMEARGKPLGADGS